MNKKIISIALVLSMLIGMLAIMPISVGAATLEKEGDVYLIKSVSDWETFAKMTKNANDKFELRVDGGVLDFGGKTYTQVSDFQGTFDGNGVVIKNISYGSLDKSEVGMFSCLKQDATAVIKNLYLNNCDFTGKQYVGAIVCCACGNATFQNIYVDENCEITAGKNGDNSYSGGLIGCDWKNETLTIDSCVFAGTVTADGILNGGFIGDIDYSTNVTINNSMVLGKVPTNGNSRGFIGRVHIATPITMTNSIYAGGEDDEAYQNTPFFITEGTTTVTNCYTISARDNGDDRDGEVYNSTKYSDPDSGVTLIEITDLLGKNDKVNLSEETWKTRGDVIIPKGLYDNGIAPIIFTQELLDGAAVRLVKDDAGLRFIAITGKDYLDFFKGEGKTVTQGIIIAPTDYITGDFTVEALGSESKYLEIEALKYVNDPEADGYYKYTGVIVDINTFNYNRDFSAIAYVKVVDDETQEATYYYSDYNEKVNSRNVADVARAALYDTKTEQVGDYQYKVLDGVYSPYTTDERTILANFCVDGDSVELEDVTFLTYNIRNIVDGKFEYEGRQNKVVSSILSYNADIIGLQEADKHSGEDWFNYLDDPTNGLLSAGYACYKGEDIKPDTFMSKDDVYNPIYYKANKFRVITELSGTRWYTEDGSCGKTQAGNLTAKHYKAFNYVVFEDIYTGARFVYINSHMETRDSESGDGVSDDLVPIIKMQAEYLDSFVDGLQSKEEYKDLPIVIGGDFNYHYGSVADESGIVYYFGEDSSIKNAAKEAQANDGKYKYGCSTTTSNFEAKGESSGPIDHWYVCGDAVVSGYEVLDNKTDGKYPSDHLPVRLTVTLTAKIKA